MKRYRKPKFSLSDWDYAPFWAAAYQRMHKVERMDMSKRVTSRNLLVVLDRLKEYAAATEDESRQAFCDDLNRFLDDLADQDAFGTEGQCDPRGDQRR